MQLKNVQYYKVTNIYLLYFKKCNVIEFKFRL